MVLLLEVLIPASDLLSASPRHCLFTSAGGKGWGTEGGEHVSSELQRKPAGMTSHLPPTVTSTNSSSLPLST